jgi:hypothetical protein
MDGDGVMVAESVVGRHECVLVGWVEEYGACGGPCVRMSGSESESSGTGDVGRMRDGEWWRRWCMQPIARVDGGVAREGRMDRHRTQQDRNELPRRVISAFAATGWGSAPDVR